MVSLKYISGWNPDLSHGPYYWELLPTPVLILPVGPHNEQGTDDGSHMTRFRDSPVRTDRRRSNLYDKGMEEGRTHVGSWVSEDRVKRVFP